MVQESSWVWESFFSSVVLVIYGGPCSVRWSLFCTVVLLRFRSLLWFGSLLWYRSPSSSLQLSFFLYGSRSSLRKSFFGSGVFFSMVVLLRFTSLLLYGSPSSVRESSSVQESFFSSGVFLRESFFGGLLWESFFVSSSLGVLL